MNAKNVINVMYILILLFGLKQMYNVYMVKKNIGRVIKNFNQRKRLLMIIASYSIVVLGFLYLYQQKTLFPLIYILLGVIFIYLTFEKISFTEKGIYFNGSLAEYEDIKQWKYSKDKKFLELTMKNARATNKLIPINPSDASEMQIIIKKNKKKQ
ncbi:DUF5673 domain-containing protein [uncultured Finegoldia sp.]|uniref:DUF5673 domain-containing protein n=1 Tax=uncultured Finegoldia sp. TaxID=328009 RepID=UPI002616D1E6|nr:DUF5673 domain-containing protein [uncultured Finegoldia sp.]